MHPVLATFSLGGGEVVLRAYSTFSALAWITAIALATLIARRRGVSWWRSLTVFVVALLVGIMGARALDLAVNWGYYAEDPSRIYDPGFRGFALYGGLILALASGALVSRALQLPLWRLADATVPALAAGIVLTRTGCFLNGCCFGTVTSLPWGVTYPAGSSAWAWQAATGQTGLAGFTGAVLPVHPTQLYEMIAALLLGALAVWLMRRQGPSTPPPGPSTTPPGASFVPTGVPFLAFALGFTLFRLGDHFLRARLITFATPSWFYPVLYTVICAGVAGLLVWRLSSSERTASPDTGGFTDDS